MLFGPLASNDIPKKKLINLYNQIHITIEPFASENFPTRDELRLSHQHATYSVISIGHGFSLVLCASQRSGAN